MSVKLFLHPRVINGLFIFFLATNAFATHTSFNDGEIHYKELNFYSGLVDVTNHSTWIGNLSNDGNVGVDVTNSKWEGNLTQEGGSTYINISSNNKETFLSWWEGNAQLWSGNTKINLDGPVLWDGNMIASFGDSTKQNIEVNMSNRSAWWGDANINTINDGVGNAKIRISNSTWQGGLNVIGGVDVSVNMSNSAIWYGNASQIDSASVNIVMDKSIWIVSKDSNVETLSMNNAAADVSNASLTVKHLSATDGLFHVDSARANNIKATTAKGNLLLMEGGTVASKDTSHAVLNVKEADNTQRLKVEGWTEHGLHSYTIKEVKPGSYYFRKSGHVSSAGGIIQSMSAAPTVVARMHDDTLFDRQGAIRLNSNDKGGVWLSYFGGINRSKTSDNADFKLHTNGVMLGGDTLIDVDNGYWLAGLAVSGAQTNLTTPGHGEYAILFESKDNDGEVKSYAMHAYLNRQYDNGIFVDSSLGFYHFSNSANINMLNSADSSHYHLNYSLNGFGGTVKAGYHHLNSNGLFFEPYARVSAMTNESVSYTLSNSTVNNDAFNSLQGEIGGKLGIKLLVQNAEINPYFQAALLNEFASGNKVYLDNESANSSIDNVSVRVGAGVQASFTENIGGYARLSYLKGENTEEPLQGLVGVKVFF
ncbi:autotransporter outer membrane beta-barrel domain-containing protein [Enterobacter mori]|uniref:autotransporter outer membrane beta-barrel domain-containing protein n=1 Tax=Enterobacter mori TaxID=539813 RepID=UPI0038916066